MKVNVIIETGSDGGFSCYVVENLPGFGLAGFGKTVQEAKKDMLMAYEEISEIMSAEGKTIEKLDFTYHYDMKSFFNYFNFLNVSKVAERAGINPSLMRKYTSGVANASQKQYDKLEAAVKIFSNELHAAAF